MQVLTSLEVHVNVAKDHQSPPPPYVLLVAALCE